MSTMYKPTDKLPTDTLAHDLEKHQEYDAQFCGARVWNAGFGGQCGNCVDVLKKDIDPAYLKYDGETVYLIDSDGFGGGLCKSHDSFLKKKGEIRHGWFELCPPCGPEGKPHAWKWNSKSYLKKFENELRQGGTSWMFDEHDYADMEIKDEKNFQRGIVEKHYLPKEDSAETQK